MSILARILVTGFPAAAGAAFLAAFLVVVFFAVVFLAAVFFAAVFLVVFFAAVFFLAALFLAAVFFFAGALVDVFVFALACKNTAVAFPLILAVYLLIRRDRVSWSLVWAYAVALVQIYLYEPGIVLPFLLFTHVRQSLQAFSVTRPILATIVIARSMPGSSRPSPPRPAP